MKYHDLFDMLMIIWIYYLKSALKYHKSKYQKSK